MYNQPDSPMSKWQDCINNKFAKLVFLPALIPGCHQAKFYKSSNAPVLLIRALIQLITTFVLLLSLIADVRISVLYRGFSVLG